MQKTVEKPYLYCLGIIIYIILSGFPLIGKAQSTQGDNLFQNCSSLNLLLPDDSVSVELRLTLIDSIIHNSSKKVESKCIGDLYYKKGLLLMSQSMQYTALAAFSNALVYYEEGDNPSQSANCLLQSGRVYVALNNYAAAIDYVELAQEYFSQGNDSIGISDAYSLLGIIEFLLDDYTGSLAYFEKSFQIAKSLNDKQRMARLYNNKAEIYEHQGDTKQAMLYHTRSLELEQQANNAIGIAISLANIGEIYDTLGQYNLAFDYYQQALEITNKEDNAYSQSDMLRRLGSLYCRIGNYTEAAGLLDKSLNIALSTDSRRYIVDCYFELFRLYLYQEEYQKSLEYYNLFTMQKDSLFSERERNMMEEIGAKHEQLRTSESDSSFAKRKFLIYALILLVIISTSFILILYRQFMQKNKTAQMLEKRNNEITKAELELRTANDELKKNEEKLQIIINEIPVMINAIDENGQFVFWNKTCEKVIGYTKDEIISQKDALQLLYPDRKKANELKDGFDKQADFFEYEALLKCKDGSFKTISWSKIPIPAPIVGWVEWSVGIDVTQQKNSERSLVNEKALLNLLIDAIPDYIFYKDTDGRYTGYNKSFCELYGIDKKTFVGKTDKEIFDTEKAERYIRTDREVMEFKQKWHAVHWQDDQNGVNQVLDTQKLPFSDEAGNLLGVIGIGRDVTQQYAYEEELKEAKEKAEASDRLKSAFLANMSHEIRSPMNAIIGFADLLRNTDTPENQRGKYIDYINSSGKNLLNLIDDIIDIAKIEAGELTIKKQGFNLCDMLSELEESYNQIKQQKNKADLHIEFVRQQDSKLSIETDDYRLRQILSNLLSNSLKFTDKGTIKFGYVDQGDFLEFFVEDTGIGIPKEKQGIIFDRFARLENNHKRNYSGTGLGLSISKHLVDLLGGKIEVSSEPLVYTRFYFTIPKKEVKQIIPTGMQQKINIDTDYHWERFTVLIAEDNQINFILLNKILQKTGIQIIRAINGEKAVKLFSEHKQAINLVLMDVQMPVMDGYEATSKIKQQNPAIPVIAQTAFAMSDERERAIASGCDDYITKPIRKEELFSVMLRFLS